MTFHRRSAGSTFALALATLLTVAAMVQPAQARTVAVEATDLPSTIVVGDVFDVDLVATAFENLASPSLKSYSGTFTSSLLRVINIVFAGALGPGSTTSVSALPSTSVSFSESTVLSDAGLDAIQPDTFVLATFTFEAIAPGSSFLSAPTSGTCTDVAKCFGVALRGPAFTVTAAPIPAALPLFLAALVGLGFFGWRHRRIAAVG